MHTENIYLLYFIALTFVHLCAPLAAPSVGVQSGDTDVLHNISNPVFFKKVFISIFNRAIPLCHQISLNFNSRCSFIHMGQSPSKSLTLLSFALLAAVISMPIKHFLFFFLHLPSLSPQSFACLLSAWLTLGSDCAQKTGLQSCHVTLWLQGQYKTCPWRW